jgi:nitronate monooxygenase
VGCGFITWSLAKKPELLDKIACGPHVVARISRSICSGADVIVAQGGEAGGHSGNRSTLTLVPEVGDLLARIAPDALLVAAGGIADGRGLAAALMLGADGLLIGSRLVASSEAATPKGFQPAIIAADGDSTVKTTVIDIVRNYDWPAEFRARAIKNRFVTTRQGREDSLKEVAANADETSRYWTAFNAGDAENAGVLIGEAAGLIEEGQTAERVLDDMVVQAETLLRNGAQRVIARGA